MDGWPTALGCDAVADARIRPCTCNSIYTPPYYLLFFESFIYRHSMLTLLFWSSVQTHSHIILPHFVLPIFWSFLFVSRIPILRRRSVTSVTPKHEWLLCGRIAKPKWSANLMIPKKKVWILTTKSRNEAMVDVVMFSRRSERRA